MQLEKQCYRLGFKCTARVIGVITIPHTSSTPHQDKIPTIAASIDQENSQGGAQPPAPSLSPCAGAEARAVPGPTVMVHAGAH